MSSNRNKKTVSSKETSSNDSAQDVLEIENTTSSAESFAEPVAQSKRQINKQKKCQKIQVWLMKN